VESRERAASVDLDALSSDGSSSDAMHEHLNAWKRLKINYKDGFSYMPGALWWPNAEVVVILFFAPSLMQRSVAVLFSSDRVVNGRGTAIFVLFVLATFFAHETVRLLLFGLRHSAKLWNATKEGPTKAQMDDPLLRLLVRVRIIKPAMRWRGYFDVDVRSKDWDEPQRTARALRMPLNAMFWKRVPGDMHATLATSWLINVSSQTSGVTYQLVKMAFQLMYSLMIGLAVHSSGFEGGEGVLVSLIVLLQAGLGLYCWRVGASADRLEGMLAGLEAFLSGTSLAFRFMSALGNEHAGLMTASLTFLAAAIYGSLVLPLYNVGLSAWRTFQVFRARTARRLRRSRAKKAAREAAREGSENPEPASPTTRRASKPETEEERALRKERKAATRITAAARGNMSRRKSILEREARLKQRHERSLREINAASVITQRYKARLAKMHAKKEADERRKAQKEKASEESAAKLIQSRCRFILLRKKVKKEKKAVTQVQAHVRGNRSRKQTEEEKEERVEMRERNRVRIARQRKAAVRIQTMARGYLSRKKAEYRKTQIKIEAKAASLIAAFWRGFRFRTSYYWAREGEALVLDRELLVTRLERMQEATLVFDERAAAAIRRKRRHEQNIFAAVMINKLARGALERRKARIRKHVQRKPSDAAQAAARNAVAEALTADPEEPAEN